tara:strand:+ start:1297 stop:1455 length:159 start_codon:yes stop_codon:yes gene_type:complete
MDYNTETQLTEIIQLLRTALDTSNWDVVEDAIAQMEQLMSGGFDEFLDEDDE